MQNRVAELERNRPRREGGLDEFGSHARWLLRRHLDGLATAEELDAKYGPLDDGPEPPPDVIPEHRKLSGAAQAQLERNLKGCSAVHAPPAGISPLTEREARR